MDQLQPFKTLLEYEEGKKIFLTEYLTNIYGDLFLPYDGTKTYVVANFVSSIDGSISLETKGPATVSQISDKNPNDRFLMGLLRALADMIVVAEGTFSASNPLTYDAIYPPYITEYHVLREKLGLRKDHAPIVVVSKGNLEGSHNLFLIPGNVIILTNASGAEKLKTKNIPSHVKIMIGEGEGRLPPSEVLRLLNQIKPNPLVLVEGGPNFFGEFLKQNLINELFLTVAPKIFGRSKDKPRLGLVEGIVFNEHPRQCDLVSIKQAGNFLFLRYKFHETKS